MDMRVRVAAYTVVDQVALAEMGYIAHDELDHPDEPVMFIERGPDEWQTNPEWLKWQNANLPREIDELHECAGRRCYNSWHRPNPSTASNAGYLNNIITVGHYSVLAHGHLTFSVEGVSRALLLELERHQKKSHLNFSVVSQRYVDHGESEMVVPPLLTAYLDEKIAPHLTVRDAIDTLHRDSLDTYDELFEFLTAKGFSRKQARGAARAVLPENTETKFLVTASVRGWRDVLEQRLPYSADEEIRLFAVEVLRGLLKFAPNSVQDYAKAYADALEAK